MKLKLIFLYFLIPYSILRGQQLPFFTQYMSGSFLWNPAVAGTKKMLDLRASYRNQWTGFDGAPKTEYVSVNSRLANGSLGLGGFVYKDETGPISKMSYSGSFAVHIRSPDVEASFGGSGSLMQYTLQGQKATIQNPGDPAFDNTAVQKVNAADAGFGFYLYNDRFHVGVSSLGLVKSAIDFRLKDTTGSLANTLHSHLYFSLGYNFSGHPDYVWENSFYGNYAKGNPIALAYSLRLFYKNKFIFGSSLRIKDAIAIHLGYIISEAMQVCYSYDFLTSSVKRASSGSHELLIAYSIASHKKKRYGNEGFQRQKYYYMF